MSVQSILRTSKTSRLIAFASGKGGVGKSVCTANLAYHLAEKHNVLTVDLDLGCGNLNASLGIRGFSHSINEFIDGHVNTLRTLKTATAVKRLKFISCSYNPIEKTILRTDQKENLLSHLRTDEADLVCLDLGAGVNDDILDLFIAADVRVLVTAPESLALHNAFMFVKSFVFRVIVTSLGQCDLPRRRKDNLVRQLYGAGDQDIIRLLDRIQSKDKVAADFIRAVLSGLQVHIILNRTQDPTEEKFVFNLQQLTRKSVHLDMNYLGSIPYDENVKKSLNEVVPFALEYQDSPANMAFRSVTTGLSRRLDEIAFVKSKVQDGGRPRALRRLGILIEGKWSKTTARLRSQSSLDRELIKDYELVIRQSGRDLDEIKAQHVNEKRALQQKIQRLENEMETIKNRHARTEKTLEESVVRRDEFIEKLQIGIKQLKQELEEKEYIIKVLKDRREH